MWKDSYKIGVDNIDRQHMALFEMTGRLLKVLEEPNSEQFRTECKNAIVFMRNYVIEHFNDEEAYQKSINYIGFTEHRKTHEEFKSNVMIHEAKLIASDFEVSVVQDFLGMVAAWLTYHVADADQKISNPQSPKLMLMDGFVHAVCTTLKTMAYIDKNDIEVLASRNEFKGDIGVCIDLTGDLTCHVEYVFAKDFVFRLIKVFLGMKTSTLDSLTCSILLEFTNIISKNAVYELSKFGACCKIGAPYLKKTSLSIAEDFSVLTTHIGNLEVGIS